MHQNEPKKTTQLERDLAWAIEPAERLGKRGRQLYEEPSTVIADYEKDLRESLKRAVRRNGPDHFWLPFLKALASEDVVEVRRRVARGLRRDTRRIAGKPGGRALLELMRRAHVAVPNSPLMLRVSPADHRRHVEAVLLAQGALQRAAGRGGERRARELAKVLAEIAESLHKPYAEALWKLVRYALGQIPGVPPAHGRILQELANQDAQLMDRDAALFRNAVDHHHFGYEPATGLLIFPDRTRRTRITADDAERRARAMLALAAGTFDAALDLFVLRAFLPPFLERLPALGIAVRGSDKAALRTLLGEIGEANTELFAELKKRHAAAPAESRSRPPSAT